jgi:hypothetical protein
MDFEKYKVDTDKFPIGLYPRPHLREPHGAKEAREYAIALDEYERNKPTMAQLREDYYLEESRLRDMFWDDLFSELGISKDHIKAKEFKRICWEYGHGGGYHEIYNVAIELVDLIT